LSISDESITIWISRITDIVSSYVTETTLEEIIGYITVSVVRVFGTDLASS